MLADRPVSMEHFIEKTACFVVLEKPLHSYLEVHPKHPSLEREKGNPRAFMMGTVRLGAAGKERSEGAPTRRLQN